MAAPTNGMLEKKKTCIVVPKRHKYTDHNGNFNGKKVFQGVTLMRTGASRFERSFLWMHRKLMSTIGTSCCRTRMRAGTAEMKATSFLVAATRMPMCQSFSKPGGCSAHLMNSGE